MAEAGAVSGPLGPGNVVLPGEEIVSPAELLMRFINENASKNIVPEGAVVGGADSNQEQKGVAALMDAGDVEAELYAPILHKRVQVRAVGPTLSQADAMGNYLFQLLNNQRWLELDDAEGNVWMCHSIYCTVGTSHHIDSPETHESLFFCSITIGSEPVGAVSP